MKYCPWGNVVGLSRVILLFESLDVSELSVGRLMRFALSGSVEL